MAVCCRCLCRHATVVPSRHKLRSCISIEVPFTTVLPARQQLRETSTLSNVAWRNLIRVWWQVVYPNEHVYTGKDTIWQRYVDRAKTVWAAGFASLTRLARQGRRHGFLCRGVKFACWTNFSEQVGVKNAKITPSPFKGGGVILLLLWWRRPSGQSSQFSYPLCRSLYIPCVRRKCQRKGRENGCRLWSRLSTFIGNLVDEYEMYSSSRHASNMWMVSKRQVCSVTPMLGIR
jgi:hypothetical protein